MPLLLCSFKWCRETVQALCLSDVRCDEEKEKLCNSFHEALLFGKGKALTVLAHKLARAVYSIWKKDTVFDQEKFLAT